MLAVNGHRTAAVGVLRSVIEHSTGHIALLFERGGQRIFVVAQLP